MKGSSLTAIVILVILEVLSCKQYFPERTAGEEKSMPDLKEIRERGTLVALTNYNSTDYFIYRGEPMGYQYEMLRALASYLQLNLELRVENDLDQAFEYLRNGDCDLLALNLTVTRDRKDFLRFTHPIGETRQVLVQRKPEDWLKRTADELDRMLIRNPLDLAGKTVYIQKDATFVRRLRNLEEEIGDTIHLVEVEEDMEKLIRMVAEGQIDYTVADENVARVNSTYYRNLDVGTAISFPQNLAWAMRKEHSDELALAVNHWIDQYRKSLDYALLYNKYFKNPKSKVRVRSDYFVLGDGKISPYDDLIRRYSDSLHWDWRLLASLIYQESHFDPRAQSWAGAQGLMQIMPSIQKQFRVSDPFRPEDNIRGGVETLLWLNDFFTTRIEDEEVRLKFVLAAYNAGLGHLMDARKLAEKYGKDPNSWEDVSYYLELKSNPRYYLDPVVQYGYCRGSEPVQYVAQIMDRYEHYVNIVPQ